MRKTFFISIVIAFWAPSQAEAATAGAIVGTAKTAGGVPIAGQAIRLHGVDGGSDRETTTDAGGDYQFFQVPFGDYELSAQPSKAARVRLLVHVSSDATTVADFALAAGAANTADVIVLGRRASSAASSSRQVSHADIAAGPQGEDIKLPKLIATTTPGVVQGPFGQSFIRGNHANIQYQIDGVQLPDSPSNTFGQAFSPRNIDHMEVITGGIPAEYGERLAAVVNIITKGGSETPGATVGVAYGSYHTLTPSLELSGSSKDGSFKYFLSGAYTQTDRGLDTPQPRSPASQGRGGSDAVHDRANDDNEFVKLAWLGGNDSLAFIGFNERDYYQIPTYPAAFSATDAFFHADFKDRFGNTGGFNYSPPATDDDQTERNRYLQLVLKHQVSADTYVQVAPYWKGSRIKVKNAPGNDLAALNVIPQSTPSSFSEDKTTDNYGLKADLTTRLGTANKLKTGFQYQTSRASGPLTVISGQGAQPAANGQPEAGSQTTTSTDNGVEKGAFEALYIQDELTAAKWLTFSLGLRFDATQFEFADVAPKDQLLQPRLGVSLIVTDSTKLHLYYGKLFQPAPVENLRDTFNTLNAGGQELTPYDIKAEKDDYYELGIDQALPGSQLLTLTTWYKLAKNMLDDAQLLNTSIAQPYNYDQGFAYGTELALGGQITDRWSEFANYSYEIAQGKGLSGGLFAFSQGQGPGADYAYLDHCQINTGNAGVRFKQSGVWWALQATYGSGLRTGPQNSKSLPPHVTADTTLGHEFAKAPVWTSGLKISADILNVSDNRYPISVANGYNGSHYAAGREYFVRFTDEL